MAGTLHSREPPLTRSLRNAKPSAIFRIRDPKKDLATAAPPRTATLGISVEPEAEVERQMQAMQHAESAPRSSGASQQPGALVAASRANPESIMTQAVQLAPHIAQNLFSYLSSFAPDSAPQTVPLLQRWLDQFQRKLQTQGLGFLIKSEQEL